MAPIRIQAQALRRREAAVRTDLLGAFALLPDDPPRCGDPGGTGEWQLADVKRAIEAAEEAGLSSYRVEIAADGSISVIVGDPGDTAPPDPHRDLFR